MSYAEYMRTKAAGRAVVLDTRNTTDSSMQTLKKKQMASRIFATGGNFVGTTITATDRPGENHANRSYIKSTGNPADASAYTNYRASQAINNDAAAARGRIIQNVNILTSRSGIIPDWILSPNTLFATGSAMNIAYGNGIWVAVGEDISGNGNNILYTSDPASGWSVAPGTPFGLSGYGNGIAYGNGIWVAVGLDGSASAESILYTSDPSTTWSVSPGNPFGNTGYGSGVAYGNSKWVVVGSDGSGAGGNILYSTNPASAWSLSPGTPFTTTGYGNGIAYGNGTWVAVGKDGSATPKNIMYASDPSTGWSYVPGLPFSSNAAAYGYAVTYANSIWVAVGKDASGTGKNIMYASDPTIAWSFSPVLPKKPFGNGGSGYGVAYGNGVWIAVGNDGAGSRENVLYTTNPAIAWKSSSPSFTNRGLAITYANDMWIMGGTNYNNTNYNIVFGTEGTSISNTPALPTPYFDGCNVNNDGLRQSNTVSLSGSDFMRQKIAAQLCANPIPHNEAGSKPAGPVFVDDTISLNGYSNCAQGARRLPNHLQKEIRDYQHNYNPNPPSQANGAFAVKGEPVTQQNAYKAGAALPRRKPTFNLGGTKHHGNDLNVNQRQVPVAYKAPLGAPAQLKINDPMQGNIKP